MLNSDERDYDEEAANLRELHALDEPAHDEPRRRKPPKRLAAHGQPHFDVNGGCLCTCRHCVGYSVEEDAAQPGVLVIRRKCICRRCGEGCPGDRLDILDTGSHVLYVERARPFTVVRVRVTDVNVVGLLDQTVSIPRTGELWLTLPNPTYPGGGMDFRLILSLGDGQ